MKKHFISIIALLAIVIFPAKGYTLATENYTGPTIDLPEILHTSSKTLTNMLENTPANTQEPIPVRFTSRNIESLSSLLFFITENNYDSALDLLHDYSLEELGELLDATNFLDLHVPNIPENLNIKSALEKAYAQKLITAEENQPKKSTKKQKFSLPAEPPMLYAAENNLAIAQHISLAQSLGFFLGKHMQQIFYPGIRFTDAVFSSDNMIWYAGNDEILYRYNLASKEQDYVASSTAITKLITKNPSIYAYENIPGRSPKLSLFYKREGALYLASRILLPGKIYSNSLSAFDDKRIGYITFSIDDGTPSFNLLDWGTTTTHTVKLKTLNYDSLTNIIFNKRFIVFAYDSGTIDFFDTNNGTLLTTLEAPAKKVLTGEHGNYLGVLTNTNTIQLYQIYQTKDITTLHENILEQNNDIKYTTIALNEDETLLGALTTNGKLYIWDTESGKLYYVLDLPIGFDKKQLSNATLKFDAQGSKCLLVMGSSIYIYTLFPRDILNNMLKKLTTQQRSLLNRLYEVNKSGSKIKLNGTDKEIFLTLPNELQELINPKISHRSSSTSSTSKSCTIM